MTFHLRYLVVSLGINISHEYIDTSNDLRVTSKDKAQTVM